MSTDAEWVGIFACAIGHYINGTATERQLTNYYREFLATPLCTPALTKELPKPPTKKVKR